MKKKIWIPLVVVVTIILGIVFYLKIRKTDDIEPMLIAKLQQLVKDGSKGLYNLKINKLQADVLASKVVLVNLSISADSTVLARLEQEQTAPDDIYKLSLNSLAIDGIGLKDLLNTKVIDLNVLLLQKPVIEIFHSPKEYNKQAKKDSTSLYEKISAKMDKIGVKKIVIEDADITYHNLQQKDKTNKLPNLNINLEDLLIDATTQYDTTRFFYAKKANIHVNDYRLRTGDSLYIFKIDSLDINAVEKNISLFNVSVNPRGNKAEFEKKLDFIKDRYDLKVKKVELKQIDWWALANEEGLWAKEMEIYNGDMEVYCDRSLPAPTKSKVGNYPHQMLTKLKLPININIIKVKDFNLEYRELNPNSEQAGSIFFSSINGTVNNVTNMPEKILVNNMMKVNADGTFMKNTALSASFEFNLAKAKEGNFSVDVSLGKMDSSSLNNTTRPLGLFEIKNGTINKLQASVKGNNTNAKGDVLLLYNDLKINALKKDDDKNGVKKRGFLSFIANTFILKDNNPSKEGKVPRKANSTYERDIRKSFFNLIWKTIMAGIISTVK